MEGTAPRSPNEVRARLGLFLRVGAAAATASSAATLAWMYVVAEAINVGLLTKLERKDGSCREGEDLGRRMVTV